MLNYQRVSAVHGLVLFHALSLCGKWANIPRDARFRLDSMIGSMPSFFKGHIWLFTYVHISYVDIEYRFYYSIIIINVNPGLINHGLSIRGALLQ